jgi:hypothetical protein
VSCTFYFYHLVREGREVEVRRDEIGRGRRIKKRGGKVEEVEEWKSAEERWKERWKRGGRGGRGERYLYPLETTTA